MSSVNNNNKVKLLEWLTAQKSKSFRRIQIACSSTNNSNYFDHQNKDLVNVFVNPLKALIFSGLTLMRNLLMLLRLFLLPKVHMVRTNRRFYFVAFLGIFAFLNLFKEKQSLEQAKKHSSISKSQTVSTAENVQNVPLILAYTKYYFDQSIFLPAAIESLKNCPYQCRWSEDKTWDSLFNDNIMKTNF